MENTVQTSEAITMLPQNAKHAKAAFQLINLALDPKIGKHGEDSAQTEQKRQRKQMKHMAKYVRYDPIVFLADYFFRMGTACWIFLYFFRSRVASAIFLCI